MSQTRILVTTLRRPPPPQATHIQRVNKVNVENKNNFFFFLLNKLYGFFPWLLSKVLIQDSSTACFFYSFIFDRLFFTYFCWENEAFLICLRLPLTKQKAGLFLQTQKSDVS